MSSATFHFHGNLGELLAVPHKNGTVEYSLLRRASVKDIIEALGVPHTEVAGLAAGDKGIDFSFIVRDQDLIHVLAPCPPVDVCTPTLLRPEPLPVIRFLADANVAKLGRLLRMAGFDVLNGKDRDDAGLAELAAEEGRIMLTRDRLLLRRKKVVFGRLVRAEDPHAQLREVVEFYGLTSRLVPFSRCMVCNGLLEPVAREQILHRLEPLTRKYYQVFRRCRECDRLYWAGSHRQGMERVLQELTTATRG